jgi:hypothetical protein
MKFLFVLLFVLVMIGINSAYGYGEISVSNFKVVNSLGEEINSPVVDQQLNLQTSLQNVSQKEVDWAYIVQVIDSSGAISDLNYATGSLVANQTLTTALSWTPHASGTYEIQILVWDNLRDIDPLAPVSTFNMTVT